ncbi:hypothetical protein [Sandarakinorhabdus limnophila]|jgi:hypothetical protein|uniref:hypothetical protein n=1 Tax=Sandarakinorhabdus limnophila TaxID=210512 RepID=UPI0026F1947C|nr:hypothetical protein [Sandarakinorhabdus limnophila]
MTAKDSESVDWIARAAARAKGRRPAYFDDPAIDRLVSLAMALTAEVSVLRERLDTVERLLEAKGGLNRAEIEAYVPDSAAGEERGEATRAYVARVMRGFQQDVEAMANPDPPITDWVEKLAKE